MKVIIIVVLVFYGLSIQAQTKIKVACVGNSITEGADIEVGMRYPDQLQKLLGDNYEVRNFGLGGRTLLKKGDFPYWFEPQYQEVLQWQPDIVIIKLGTNDSKPQNWIYSEEFENDYRAFIRSFIKERKPKIFVCTPVPVFREIAGINESIVKEEIVPMVNSVANAEKIMVIDLFTGLNGKDEFFPDGVHPNTDGAGAIAQEVYRVVATVAH